MSSVVGICNRALQKLGATKIVSLDDSSKNARACNNAYQAVLDSELRKHNWSFAIRRVSLAANAVNPIFGGFYSYPLPSDFLRLLNPDPAYNYSELDWNIEGRELLTAETGPLNVRYIARVEDPNQMDPVFKEVLAVKLADEMCEELTQSNSKREALATEYIMQMRDARRTNAIEKTSELPPEDSWVTVRS